MTTERHVASITWGFDDEKLFYNLDRNSRRCYDISASAQSYARLCKRRLTQAYPNAKNIQIEYRINPNNQDELLPNLVETNIVYSFDGDDFDNYGTSDDIENVERICDKACNERWEKRRDWHSLTELSKRFKVPTALSRLACQTRLIKDMWIDESVWKVFHKDFVDFAGKFKIHVNQELVAIKFNNESHSLQSMMLAELAEIEYIDLQNIAYWVTKLEVLNLPTIYDANNSIITLQFDHSQLLLTLYFFNTGNRLEGVDWTFDAFAKSLVSEASKHPEAEATQQEYQYIQGYIESVRVSFKYQLGNQQSLREQIEQAIGKLRHLTQDAKIALEGGIKWLVEYEQKGHEDRFRDEVLDPLLRHMGYREVRNRHGRKEYGKDFTFSEETRFKRLLRYGLQAKAGNISGAAGSEDIEMLLSQLKLAFRMPYREPLNDPEKRYIAVFIIAISGVFTENAQEIIIESVSEYPKGSVFFWDKFDIIGFIDQKWPKDKPR